MNTKQKCTKTTKTGEFIDYWFLGYIRKLLAFSALIYSQFYILGFVEYGILLLLFHYGNHYFFHHMFKFDYSKHKLLRKTERVNSVFTPLDEHFIIFFIGPILNQFPIFFLTSTILYMLNSFYAVFIKKVVR